MQVGLPASAWYFQWPSGPCVTGCGLPVPFCSQGPPGPPLPHKQDSRRGCELCHQPYVYIPSRGPRWMLPATRPQCRKDVPPLSGAVCYGWQEAGWEFCLQKSFEREIQLHVKTPANKTPERDLVFARHHIKSCQVTVVRGGEDSLAEASVRCLHQDYVKRCSQEGRKPVGIDVFRKLCHCRPSSKVLVKS